jgi:hypothetical protein
MNQLFSLQKGDLAIALRYFAKSPNFFLPELYLRPSLEYKY